MAREMTQRARREMPGARGRAVWKSHIKFNLVTVPIGLYIAAHGSSNGVYFNQSKRGAADPPAENMPGARPRRVARDRKGYEYAEDQYVLALGRGKQTLVASSPADMNDRVINLMDALEKSLEHAKAEKPAKRRKAS